MHAYGAPDGECSRAVLSRCLTSQAPMCRADYVDLGNQKRTQRTAVFELSERCALAAFRPPAPRELAAAFATAPFPCLALMSAPRAPGLPATTDCVVQSSPLASQTRCLCAPLTSWPSQAPAGSRANS